MVETFPRWVAEEVQNAKFELVGNWEGSGYILDLEKDNAIDVQFYERLPEGRYIATLELPSGFNKNSLEMATVYVFKFKAFKSVLPKRVVDFLKEKYDYTVEDIYRFELLSAEKLDVGKEEVVGNELPEGEE
jgi:hypothetical protein